MRRIKRLAIIFIVGGMISFITQSTVHSQQQTMKTIRLPSPRYTSGTSVEEALLKRRSVREYKSQPLELQEISQLLWAAQGITEPIKGFRTAPSAGALYPLEVYLVAGDVKGIEKGVYKYIPAEHELVMVNDKDVRRDLCAAALGQEQVLKAPAVIVISAVLERTAKKYRDRAQRYVDMEAGHAAQNVFLQAVALHCGTVVIGAFDDEKVKQVVNLDDREVPLYLMPVGK